MIQWECIQICEKNDFAIYAEGNKHQGKTMQKGKPCKRKNYAKEKPTQKEKPAQKKNPCRRGKPCRNLGYSVMPDIMEI